MHAKCAVIRLGLNSNDAHLFSSLFSESLLNFVFCITTYCLARSASINDSLLAEVMKIFEDSSCLSDELNITEGQLSW